MARPLESVPNFSEGRDRSTIEALGEALGRRARLLDVHSDPDHNRSVFTLVGSAEELIESLLAGIECALVPEEMERAREAALALAERVGGELGMPVFLYGELAPGRGPAFFRRGGLEELTRRLESGEVAPEFGPARLDERAGGVLVGARRPLIAFNVNLRGSLEVAQEVARSVRERDGGFPGVRALGLELPSAGLVQVSMNVEDYEAVALHEIVDRIGREAAAHGAEVAGSELVGLMPAGAAVAAAGAMLAIRGFDASRVLELRLLEE